MKFLNHTLKILLGAVLLFGFSSQGIAQTERPERPELIVFPELNPIQVPEVTRFTYRGIQFFLVEDRELPLISMNVRIRAGSWLEPEEKTGLASLTGIVMRSGGIASKSSDELNEFLEDRAASMETSFSLTLGTASMNILKEDFDTLLPVFIELLTQPAFEEDKFNLAITQSRGAISRRNDSPAGIAAREFNNIIYGRQTVFNRTQEFHHLDNISREDLVEFHKNAVVAENLMVGIIGDFNTRDMLRKLERAFRNIPSGRKNEFAFPEIDYDFTPRFHFVDRSDMTQSIIRIGHIGGLRDNPDYAALQVMNQILSGGFSGRLMQEVRTRQGLAYSVGGSFGSNVLFPGVFFAGLSTVSENTGAAINATLHEIRRLQDEGVTQQELDDTRSRFLNSLVFRNENRASVLNEQLSNTYIGLPLDAFERYVEEVRVVTPEDIQRVAREYLQPDNVQILVVGNSARVGDQLDQFVAHFGEINVIDVTIPRPAPSAAVASGDTAKGTEWLQKMGARLIGDTTFERFSMSGKFAQGPMQLDVNVTYGFPGFLRQEIVTPMGSQVISFENGEAKVSAGGQEQQLPPQFAAQFRNTLNRHYLNLAKNAGSLEVVYLGSEEVNDHAAVKLFIAEYELHLFLDAETALPIMMQYSEFNPQAGAEVNYEAHFSDWTEANGVKAAWKEIQKANGEVQATITVSSHSVE